VVVSNFFFGVNFATWQSKKKANATSTKEFFGHNGLKVFGFRQQFLAFHQNITRFLNLFVFLFGL
jgi:hypothetical protein